MYKLLATDDGEGNALVCAYTYEADGQSSEEPHGAYTTSLADAVKLRQQLDEVIALLQHAAS